MVLDTTNPTADGAEGNKTGNTTGNGDSSKKIAGLLANHLRPFGAVTKNKAIPKTAPNSCRVVSISFHANMRYT